MVLAPGPPPGRRLLTWRHYALTPVAAAALMLAGRPGLWLPAGAPVLDRTPEGLAVAGVIAVIAGLMLAASPASRRLLASLAVPLYFYLASVFLSVSPPRRVTGTVLLVDVPFAAVLLSVVVAVALARRRRSRLPASGAAA
jgi:hypothetical protein